MKCIIAFALALAIPVLTPLPVEARGNGKLLGVQMSRPAPINRLERRKALRERAADSRASDPLPDGFDISGGDGPSSGLPLLIFALGGLALTLRTGRSDQPAS